jgi:DNA repair exonuclease SbcCD ATPase subunit
VCSATIGGVPRPAALPSSAPTGSTQMASDLVERCESLGAEYGAIDMTYPTAAETLREAAAALKAAETNKWPDAKVAAIWDERDQLRVALKAAEAEQAYFSRLHEEEWRRTLDRAEQAEADLTAARADIERLTSQLAFADEQAKKLEAIIAAHVEWTDIEPDVPLRGGD